MEFLEQEKKAIPIANRNVSMDANARRQSSSRKSRASGSTLRTSSMMAGMAKNQNFNPFLEESQFMDQDEDDNEFDDDDDDQYEFTPLPMNPSYSNKPPPLKNVQATLAELARWEKIRESQDKRALQHEIYFAELEKAEDGFLTIANNFGRTTISRKQSEIETK